MGMKIQNTFDVPLPVDRAWALLLNAPEIVRSIPGASLTRVVDAQTFEGSVDVRLGPVAMTFEGVVKLLECDRASLRMRLQGAGKEKKARGQAASDVILLVQTLSPSRTRVSVDTDLTLTGQVAQYGRGAGMVKAVSEEIVARFAENLRQRIAAGGAEGPQAAPVASSLPALSVLWSAFVRWLGRAFAKSRDGAGERP